MSLSSPGPAEDQTGEKHPGGREPPLHCPATIRLSGFVGRRKEIIIEKPHPAFCYLPIKIYQIPKYEK